MSQQVKIFDTTLRDGQQCPGAGMSFEENIKYAHLISELGVDVIEAGFPSASNLDFEIVQAISKELRSSKSVIAGLCQLREAQVDSTMESLEAGVSTNQSLIHVYVPVAPDLMEASLGEKANKIKIIEDLGRIVKKVTTSGFQLEFSPEGYSRQGENFDFVTDLIVAAIENGASVINCPDTIGASFQYHPETDFVLLMNRHAKLIKDLFPNKNITWSAHCHNDFNLAVANSMRAVYQGPVRQIEGCMNGVGERAGNTALESVIMLFDTYGKNAKDDTNRYYTNCDITKLQRVSDFISKVMLPRQPHWPVTGDNAAKHSSGGHTNAVLNNPLAYQPFDPRRIGKEISFTFGPLSGSNHAQDIINKAGYQCSDEEKVKIAQSIKDIYSERRKGVTDEEVISGFILLKSPLKIKSYDYARKEDEVILTLNGQVFDREGTIVESYSGKDSALAAFKKLVDKYFLTEIVSHASHSDGSGINAESVSKIIIKVANSGIGTGADQSFTGRGRDSDIEVSALKAFQDAINNAYVNLNYLNQD